MGRRKQRTTTATFAIACLLAASLAAGSLTTPYVGDQQTKIAPEELGPGARFPFDVAASQDRVAFGSPLTSPDGAVFIYNDTETGLTYNATLTNSGSDETEQAEFGDAVATDSGTLVVGATGVDTPDRSEVGAAYVYEATGDGWQLEHTIPSPDPDALDRFGAAVAVDGDTIVVSEPEDEIEGEYSSNGAVHVYEDTEAGLTHVAELTPPDDPDRERLGVSLALEDGTLAAGAPGDETPNGTGAVYVYEETSEGWAQVDRLTAPPSYGAEQLGRDVALGQGTILAGAPGPQVAICCPSPPVPEGQAHVFQATGDGFEHQAELDPVTSHRGNAVGMAVDLDGDRAFVAAPNAPFDSVYGWVAVFEQGSEGWEEDGRVVPADPASGDRFGDVMAAQDGELFVGAPGDDEAGHQAGAAYAFGNLVSGLTDPS